MNFSQFTRRVYIKASLKTVFDCWATAAGLQSFFLRKARFVSAAGSVRKLRETFQTNDNYDWQWFVYAEGDSGKVLNVLPNQLVHFSFIEKSGVEVKVDLSREGKYTLVQLTQFKIPKTRKALKNIYIECSLGWGFYLLNLKSVLEGGLDLREKDRAHLAKGGVVNF